MAAQIIGERRLDLRQNARVRRFSLSVSRIDGRIRVTAPANARPSQIRSFIDDHLDWLAETLGKAAEPILLTPGAVFPFRGAAHKIVAKNTGRGVEHRPQSAELAAGGGPAEAGFRVEAWLKEQARAYLRDASDRYAAQIDRPYSSISIRDTRSRWGSCSSQGGLSYSWRLVLAPPEILDYVAAHEVCHLIEMNHSDRFWALVERLRPHWRREREWLKANGVQLHRYMAAVK